jgi:3'-phosphoadenosine 5'-phosphosulfate (PAPS) 3'-phosphatase
VASGEVNAASGLNAKHDWDLVAADPIVHEAGGFATAHDGERLIYNGVNTLQHAILAPVRQCTQPLFASCIKLRSSRARLYDGAATN